MPWAAQATDFTVTKTADTADGTCDADCSLREAVVAANAAGGGPHTISIPAGTFTLSIEPASSSEIDASAGDLDLLTGTLTIQGAGRDETIIDGNGVDRVFEGGGTSITIRDLTIRGGQARPAATGRGGGINQTGGTLTLSSLTITGNTANGGGAGIDVNQGTTLVIEDSFLTANESSGGPSAINSRSENVRVSRTTFSENGLVLAANHNVVEINASNPAEVVLENCTFSGNGGTALKIFPPLDETTVTVENCTFDHDQNAAIDIASLDYLTVGIAHSTFAGTGTGIDVESDGTPNAAGAVTLANTLLASSGANCSGTIVSAGGNLFSDTTGCTVTLQSGDLTGETCLGSFLEGDEPGEGVIPLITGSPAIDAGVSTVCVDDLATDQLGTARSGGCDIGAFEWTSSCGQSCEGTCDLGTDNEDDDTEDSDEDTAETESDDNEDSEGTLDSSGGGCSLILGLSPNP